MDSKSFDSEQYKARQRQDWDATAAGWKKWWPTIEQSAQHVSNSLVEMAGIQPGMRVLDVASGIGEPAVTAANIVGPDGSVVATDHSAGMLAIAQERAAHLGLSNLETKQVDGEQLDYPANSFDAALCRWGLMLMPDPTASASRVAEVLVAGGKFAAAVWGPPPKVPFGSVMMGVIMKELKLPPPPAGTPGLFSLGAPGALESVFSAAGFDDVQVADVTVTFDLPSADAFVEMFQDTAGAVTAMMANLSSDRQDAIWEQVGSAVGQFASNDGSLHIPNLTVCVVGTKPQ